MPAHAGGDFSVISFIPIESRIRSYRVVGGVEVGYMGKGGGVDVGHEGWWEGWGGGIQ